jgi:hypothetical protein
LKFGGKRKTDIPFPIIGALTRAVIATGASPERAAEIERGYRVFYAALMTDLIRHDTTLGLLRPWSVEQNFLPKIGLNVRWFTSPCIFRRI